MQPGTTEPAFRRLFLGLVVFVTLSIGLTLFPSRPAVASPDPDPALEQAVSAAIIAQQPTAATAHIFVSPIARVEAWVFGSAGVIPQPASTGESDEETYPYILLFFAEQQDSGWRVAIEHTAAFREALTRIPRNLLTPEQWLTMPTAAQLSGDGSTWLNLPWAIGETWYLTGGPHNHGGVRAALDFAVNGGIVRAAREGVAYTPCGRNSDYVRIDHHIANFSTNYYHLSGITVNNGSWVNRYAELGRVGNTANCLGGYSLGAHVHFWISRQGRPVPIDGVDIGGWTVSALPGDYNGCMTRIRDGYRQCAGNGRITNEGVVGSGNIPPNPPILISPADGATVRTAQVTLQVNDGGDPDNGPHPMRSFFFRIVKEDNSWSAESGWIDNRQPPVSWTVNLPGEGTYKWWALAGDWVADSPAAGPRTLHYRRNVPPNPPILVSPADNVTFLSAQVTLQVADGGDPDNWPNSARRFLFRIAKEDNSWSVESGWTDRTNWTVQLPGEGAYKWWVRATDGEADSPAAGPRTLRYRRNIPPNPPILVSPADGATVLSAQVTLRVADGGDPDNWPRPTRTFFFRIVKEDNSWSAESGWTDRTSWTVQLPGEGVYRWWARAGDGPDESAASPRTLRYTPVFAIRGRVLDSRGVPVAGVTVSDGTRAATTDANGAYALTNVPAGTYTLTPSRDGYTFTPPNRTVTVNGDVGGMDFAAVRMVYLPMVIR